MLTITLLLGLLVGIYWYLRKCHSLFRRLQIPGPNPILLFGNVAEFKDKFPLDVFKAWQQKYGKVFGYYEGLNPSIVISDPSLTQQILVKKFSNFSHRPSCTPFLHEGDELSIQNANGELWKRQRSVVAKAFHTKGLHQIVPVVCQISQRLLQCLESANQKHQDGFEISSFLERYTLDAFANAAFDYNSDSLNDDDELLFKFMLAYNNSGAADNPLAGFARLFPYLTSFLKTFDTNHHKLHQEHLHKMRQLIQKEKQKIEHNPNDRSPNLLRRLIEGYSITVDEDNNEVKRHLSDDEVLSQVSTLVGGGLGPTHSVLVYATHVLATNPEVQEKLFQEITEVCPNDEPLSVENLSRLEYLDMVIDETSRMFPVIPGVARTCTDDCEIDGIKFTKDMKVRIMATSMYEDETLYPEPGRFVPERFCKHERDSRPFYSFLPFGHGPRMCPGYKFGLIEIKVAIVQILRKYVITKSSKTEMPPKPALRPFLCPENGIFVTLIPRGVNT